MTPIMEQARGPWSRQEIDLIVAGYFEMLQLELKEQPYSKTDHNAALRQLIPRTKGAIEWKHQNISAVLDELGMPRIRGYKPARNYQQNLVDGILHYLEENPSVFTSVGIWTRSLPEDPTLTYEKAPPPAGSRNPRWEFPEFRQLIHKVNHALKDETRRNVGVRGEELVLEHEREILHNADRKDLAKKVRWVSREDGDGAGYDIRSYNRRGEQRLLEVKTTLSQSRTAHFFLTENELRVSEERQDVYRLVRVYDAAGLQPKAFRLRPPLENSVRLRPVNYRASLL